MEESNSIIALVGRSFRFAWKVLERIVKSIQVIIFLVFIVIIVAALRNLSGGGISVPESAALVVAPSGFLVEQPEGEPLDIALSEMQEGEGQTVVRNVVDSLRRAATDDRIQVVVLLTDGLQGGGLSKEQAIGAALDEFKASGKRVVAMGDNYNQSQYYLAARADEVYMHDFGFVLIEGFGYFKTYFADAIEKLKVDVNVFRVGEFKSFVEPYLRNDMSEEDKEASKRWLESLWAIYKRDVLQAREIDAAVFDAYATDPSETLEAANGDAAAAALETGLIDGVMDHHEFRRYIIDIVGENPDEPGEFQYIDYRSYLTATDMEQSIDTGQGPKVAVIVASGNIVDGEAAPGTIGSASLNELIRKAANDEEVAALVLRVDSPGGSMFASEVVLDQLQEVRAQGKPVVASMSSVAASGGYYISMAANEIWAAESTISGSIGVGAIFPTFQRSIGSLGVNIDGIGTTEFAGQLSPVRELGKDARRLLDISVRSAYDVFIGKVAEARSMEADRVDEIAQGRVWIGGDALELGLVDNIGDIDEAIGAAAELAGIGEEDYRVEYVQRQLSPAELVLLQYARLLGAVFGYADAGQGSAVKLLQGWLMSLERELGAFAGWNDPRGIYYHCLCELR
jgi:protease-4